MSLPAADRAVPGVSVVIVSFNTRALLERCLDSVRAGAPGLAREVIVVDNASSDDSVAWVRDHRPEVRLIVNRENRGYAPACNQGLRAARAPYVLALNSDAFLGDGALEALVGHLREHPDTAAVGPRLRNADGTTQWVCARRAPEFMNQWVGGTLLPSYVPATRAYVMRSYPADWYDGVHDAEVLSGACTLYRREALDRYGLLDERLTLNYDDVEWCGRARRRGARLRYDARAEVTHLGGGSRVIDLRSNHLANVASTFAFWEISFAPPLALCLKLTLISSLLISLGYSLMLSPFGAPRRRAAVERLGLLAHSLRRLPRAAPARDAAG